MSAFYTFFVFFITFSILIFVHELGHFLVARMFNVKILTFSVGFGKSIFSWRDRNNTEYKLGFIPLGGYVKMLCAQDVMSDSEDYKYTLDAQHPWKKMLIVIAGPAINILLAFIIYFIIGLLGTVSLKPIVTGIVKDSPLYGSIYIDRPLVIDSINDVKVRNYSDAYMQLALLKDNKDFKIVFADPKDPLDLITYNVKNLNISLNNLRGIDLLNKVGLIGYQVDYNFTISGFTQKDSEMKIGDQIVSYDSIPIKDISSFTSYIQEKKTDPILLKVKREGGYFSYYSRAYLDKSSGNYVLGISFSFNKIDENYLYNNNYNLLDALYIACYKVSEVVRFTIITLYNIFFGNLSFDNLGGPFETASYAKHSFSMGVISYLSLLALISINLGVFNMIPIPVLDGGSFVLYFVEMLTGISLSGFLLNVFTVISILLILSFSFYVFLFDFFRFFKINF